MQNPERESIDMKYFDSHAHYYDDRFSEECEEGADGLISRLLADDIAAIVNVGTCLDTCKKAIEQAKKYKNMYLCYEKKGFLLMIISS
jgi:Tat protein secretion system quality control protein TatD with DNase activity